MYTTKQTKQTEEQLDVSYPITDQSYTTSNNTAIMRSSPVLILSALAVTNAFAPNTNLSVRNMNVNHDSGLHMTVKVPITLTGDNIDLTPSLTDYANQKLDRTLGKLSTMSGVTHCDVYLTVNKNPKVRDIYVYIIMMTSRH